MGQWSDDERFFYAKLSTATAEWIGEHLIRIFQVRHALSRVSLDGDYEELDFMLQGALKRVSLETAENHIDAFVQLDTPDDSWRRDWVMGVALYNENPAPSALVQRLMGATAAATDHGWKFLRRSPSGGATLRDIPRVIEQLVHVHDELDAESDAARRAAGSARVFQAIHDVFQESSRRVVKGGALLNALRPAIEADVERLMKNLADARLDEAAYRTVFDHLLPIVESGWIRVFPKLAQSLHTLPPSDAIAAKTLKRMLASGVKHSSKENRLCRFNLAERLGRPDVMLKYVPQARSWPLHQRILSVHLKSGAESALAFLDGLEYFTAERTRWRTKLLIELGRDVEVLDDVEVDPRNLAAQAKQLGVTVDQLVAVGIRRSRDKGVWLERALTAGAFGRAMKLAQSRFHPRDLVRLLRANSATPPKLAGQLVSRSFELVFDPNTDWLDADGPKQALLDIVREAEAMEPNQIPAVRRRLSDRLGEQASLASSFMIREAAFDVQETINV